MIIKREMTITIVPQKAGDALAQSLADPDQRLTIEESIEAAIRNYLILRSLSIKYLDCEPGIIVVTISENSDA